MPSKQEVTRPIYTIDIETDPFVYGRDPQPFACGLFDGTKFRYTWGVDCMTKMHAIVHGMEPGILYAHNGGKFDFYYMMDWLANEREMLIINGRIVKADAYILDSSEFHQLRDSFALMPFALKKYKKERIDYRCFETENRDSNKKEILNYLKKDCQYLHELCVSFHERFGDNLTIASTSMKEFKKQYSFTCLTSREDDMLREPFYFGGRVQCFEKGIITPTRGEKIQAYDLNQCYPFAMSNFTHPISAPDGRQSNVIIDGSTYFLTVEGYSHGAFPTRKKDGLSFAPCAGEFHVTIHEFNAAIETGMFELHDVLRTYNFRESSKFDKFVTKFHKLRRDAQLSNDDVGALFYKYVGNSCYGKFAQRPDDYHSYMLTDDRTNLNPKHEPDNWFPCTLIGFAGYILWKRPSLASKRYNVATGASITGAARSLLIRGIAKAKRPLYCDTDSLICERLEGVPIDATKIGHWKLEHTATKMAIGGRKLYTLFSHECPSCGGRKKSPIGDCKKSEDRNDLFHDYGACKIASKGVHLNPAEILRVCQGHEVEYYKAAPTFDFKAHASKFIKRTVRMT